MSDPGHDTYLGHSRFDAAAVARVFRWAGPTSHVVRTMPDGFEMAFDDSYVEATCALTDRETRALLALGPKHNWDHDALWLWKRARRQAMRREMLKSFSPGEVAEMRARIECKLGSRTRPVDRLSPLCWRLRDRVGLSYQEIVDLLDGTELEKRPKSGGAAKVQRRVDRFGKRLSSDELKKLRAGTDRELGPQRERAAA